MCHDVGLTFIAEVLAADEVTGRSILEVGSQNVNGSPRSVLEPLGPVSYIGVDLQPGPGVDECVDADRLLERFGPDAFDIVVSTEMLEHVKDWQSVITNLKAVTKPSGLLLITTRSKGYPYHAYPHDFWRYELSDMRRIFGDMEIESLVGDPAAPGVFLRARKPAEFREVDTSQIRLYSMAAEGRRRQVVKSLARVTPRWAEAWAKQLRRRILNRW